MAAAAAARGPPARWIFASALMLLASVFAGPCSAQTPQTPQVACAVEPALASDEPLALHAWAVDGSGMPVALPAGLRWRADRGEVDDTPAAAGVPIRWTVPDRPRSGALHARLVGRDGQIVCSVTVRRVPGARAMDPPTGAARARHFLARDRDEPRGYAALSYLLLPSPPAAAAERERCVRVIAAWLRQLPPTAEMEQYVERNELTLFLLPLRDVPPLKLDGQGGADPQAYRAAAQTLLASYDHVRAQALLARMGLATAGSGPWLVTRQAAPPGSPPPAQLVEDFGAVDPSISEAWMHWSLSLVSQPREGSGEALQRVAMTLRNVIAHVARSLPDGGAGAREAIRVSTAPAR